MAGAPGAIRRVGSTLADLVFVAPALVLLAAFVIVPSLWAIAHSLTAWNPGFESPWVGLDNFVAVARDEVFHQVLVNQAVLLLGVPLWTILPLLVALLLYERVPAPGVFRTILFFPAVLSPAIVAILFRMVLRPDGTLNELLQTTGLGFLANSWIDDPALVKPVLIAVIAWSHLGGGVIIFSAGLSSIPPDLFEAAEMDGANWWQRLRHVMLPSIRPLIEFYVILQTLSVFLWIFGWIYVLTQGGPGYASTTIDYHIYTSAFLLGKWGYAAAAAVYLLLIIAVLVAGGRILSRAARS